MGSSLITTPMVSLGATGEALIGASSKMRKGLRHAAMLATTLILIVSAVVVYLIRASLPITDGNLAMAGLAAPARVEFDQLGIPRIHAQTREDAFHVLGFVTASDRLFQMDLLRRKMTGRLAEILGSDLRDTDLWHRTLGFDPAATAIFNALPEAQKRVLTAYAQGINQAIAGFDVLPFEFLLLGYAPEPWRVEDSLLAVLAMEITLGWTGGQERAATVMQAALPPKVAEFLLPKVDAYTRRLLGLDRPGFLDPPLPVADLAAVLHRKEQPPFAGREDGLVKDIVFKPGSNAWLVGAAKGAGGRAILANDMHLDLGVPNIWYRAELHYDGVQLAGLTLPGLPVVISGSNQRVAWGFTASGADVSDLVMVDSDSQDASRYLTPHGSVRFGQRTETIRVRGEADWTAQIRTTEWGPVLPEPLLGKPVAVRWTALDPRATNLDYLDLDRIGGVQEALFLMNRAGGPVLNAFVADVRGNIGWTMTGSIPVRFGMDGLHSRSWAQGGSGWKGYIAPDVLPRMINPPDGFIANANQRMVGPDYPYAEVGSYDWRGSRAYRISQRLAQTQAVTEPEMLALQTDTHTEFYDYYRDLAFSVLDADTVAVRPELAALRRHLMAWNGQAGVDSLGLGVLVEFRERLMKAVLSPLVAPCRDIEAKFEYEWPHSDVPLQRLLDTKLPELLPNRARYPDWNAFIREILLQSVDGLKSRYHTANLDELTWGRINEPTISHPLSAVLSPLSPWLDMPTRPMPDCPECIRTGGVSERLVVAPGQEGQGILHMPAGQSGHPLSPHYRDQQPAWAAGTALPLLAGGTVHRLDFTPSQGGVSHHTAEQAQ